MKMKYGSRLLIVLCFTLFYFSIYTSTPSYAAPDIGALKQEVANAQNAVNKAQVNFNNIASAQKNAEVRVKEETTRRENTVKRYNEEVAKLNKAKKDKEIYGNELSHAKAKTNSKKTVYDGIVQKEKGLFQQAHEIEKTYTDYWHKGNKAMYAIWGEKLKKANNELLKVNLTKPKAHDEWQAALGEENILQRKYDSASNAVKVGTNKCGEISEQLKDYTKSTQEALNLLAEKNKQYHQANAELSAAKKALADAQSRLSAGLSQ